MTWRQLIRRVRAGDPGRCRYCRSPVASRYGYGTCSEVCEEKIWRQRTNHMPRRWTS